MHEADNELTETEVIWVAQGYSGENFARVVQQICGARVEVIKRISKTFEILSKRWLVARTCRLVEPLSPLDSGLRVVTISSINLCSE